MVKAAHTEEAAIPNLASFPSIFPPACPTDARSTIPLSFSTVHAVCSLTAMTARAAASKRNMAEKMAFPCLLS